MWKLLTGIVADEIFNHVKEKDLLLEEQKGCCKNRGKKGQLLMDMAVMKNCRKRRFGLGIVWIDYWKAYDMVPHSWSKKFMEMCGVADNNLIFCPREWKACKRS